MTSGTPARANARTPLTTTKGSSFMMADNNQITVWVNRSLRVT